MSENKIEIEGIGVSLNPKYFETNEKEFLKKIFNSKKKAMQREYTIKKDKKFRQALKKN